MEYQQVLRRDVFSAGGLPVGAARLSLGEDVAPHSHDFIEIAVVTAPGGSHVRDAEEVSLVSGAVFALRPGDWHAYANVRGAEVFNLYIGDELLHRELSWTLRYPTLATPLLRGGRTVRPLPPERVCQLTDWLQRLASLRTAWCVPDTASALGYVCCALAQVAQADFDVSHNRGLTATVAEGVRLMVDDPAHTWRIAELTNRLHISSSQLTRLFTRDLGLPPMAWLARTRFELAASLLIGTDRAVSDVGRAAGWPDPNYFSRQFGRFAGIAPTEYRRRFARPLPQ